MTTPARDITIPTAEGPIVTSTPNVHGADQVNAVITALLGPAGTYYRTLTTRPTRTTPPTTADTTP